MPVFNGSETISIHALREEGDHVRQINLIAKHDFYPRPPRGGRLPLWVVHSKFFEFLSTPSARRATCFVWVRLCAVAHFYPRPPRGGRPRVRRGRTMFWSISIHALREEGDALLARWQSKQAYFYPRPPRGGRRLVFFFLCLDLLDFYPRPPRGGRPIDDGFVAVRLIFLSTPSARRATSGGCRPGVHRLISIHALREEGDGCAAVSRSCASNFYPRPPRGGRLLCQH